MHWKWMIFIYILWALALCFSGLVIRAGLCLACQVYIMPTTTTTVVAANNKLENYVNEFLNLFSVVKLFYRFYRKQKKKSCPRSVVRLSRFISGTWQAVWLSGSLTVWQYGGLAISDSLVGRQTSQTKSETKRNQTKQTSKVKWTTFVHYLSAKWKHEH